PPPAPPRTWPPPPTDEVKGEARRQQRQRLLQQRVLRPRRLRGGHALQRDAARGDLVQHAEGDLERGEQRVVAEGDGDAPVLRQRPVAVLHVHLRDELVQDAQADDTVRDGGLQELLRLHHDLPDGGAVVAPRVLGDAAQQLHHRGDGELLQPGALVRQQRQDV